MEDRLARLEDQLAAAQRRLRLLAGLSLAVVIAAGALLLPRAGAADGPGSLAALTNAQLTKKVKKQAKRLNALETLLTRFSRVGNDVFLTGANLHVLSGTGATDAAVNGLGNLIVGYNELRGAGDDRSGSHNIVVGRWHNYTSYGGVVVGIANTISGPYASVSGGSTNQANGPSSSVSGGNFNTASGINSSVSGGQLNQANGLTSSVSGGQGNQANGPKSSVSGGAGRTALADWDWVAGELFQDQ